MTVFQTMRCPRCGTVRAAHAAPLDLCPACLLAAALSTDDDPCPYQVLAPIGGGAGGVTYLAQALRAAGGYVALKILKPRDDVDAARVGCAGLSGGKLPEGGRATATPSATASQIR